MAKKGRTYHFRDNSKLLENIPDGKKSEYIREALHLRTSIDEDAYKQEQVTINELKEFYNKQLLNIDHEIECLDEDMKLMTKMKQRIQTKLRKVLKKEDEIDNLIVTRKELLKTGDLEHERETIADSIIRNIMFRREDPTMELLNLDFLRQRGEFLTKDEFKTYVLEFVDNKFKEGMVYNKWILKDADIEYMKLHVNRLIK